MKWVIKYAWNSFAIVGVLAVGLLIFSKFTNTQKWNREVGPDIHQSFTTAYLDLGNGKSVKLRVANWRDFDDSDQLQFTTTEGITYLTGCSRVILTDEQ